MAKNLSGWTCIFPADVKQGDHTLSSCFSSYIGRMGGEESKDSSGVQYSARCSDSGPGGEHFNPNSGNC